MSLGRTGMMIPSPSTSSTSVMKMNPRAGLRGVDGSIPPILYRPGAFGKPKRRSVLELRHQLVHALGELRPGLDVERLPRPLDGGAGLRHHVQLRKVLREGDDDLVEEHRAGAVRELGEYGVVGRDLVGNGLARDAARQDRRGLLDRKVRAVPLEALRDAALLEVG